MHGYVVLKSAVALANGLDEPRRNLVERRRADDALAEIGRSVLERAIGCDQQSSLEGDRTETNRTCRARPKERATRLLRGQVHDVVLADEMRLRVPDAGANDEVAPKDDQDCGCEPSTVAPHDRLVDSR